MILQAKPTGKAQTEKGQTQMAKISNTTSNTTSNPFASLIPARDTALEAIKVIDVKLAASAGNVAERRKAALETLAAAGNEDISTLDKVTAELEAIKQAHVEAKQAVDEAISGYLRGQKDENTEAAATLKVERDALLVTVTSMETLISGATKPVTASDLGLKASRSSGSTGGTRAKTSKGTFAYSADGTSWTTPNDHQQSLSSIAFRKFDRATVVQLRTAMAEVNGGIVVDETQSFELRPTCNGKAVTIKFEVAEVPSETS